MLVASAFAIAGLMPRRQRDCVDCAESGESSLIWRVSGHLQACPVADPSGPPGKLSRIMSEVKAISPDILFVAGWSGSPILYPVLRGKEEN